MSFAALLLREFTQIATVAADGGARHVAASAASSAPRKKTEGCSPCAALAAQQKAREQVLAFKKKNGF